MCEDPGALRGAALGGSGAVRSLGALAGRKSSLGLVTFQPPKA